MECGKTFLSLGIGLYLLITYPVAECYQVVNAEVERKDGKVFLKCKADGHWEHCTWIHGKYRMCHFEWQTGGDITQEDCSAPLASRIQIIKEDYDKYECNVELSSPTALDEGTWKCNMEKYVLGGVRGATSHQLINFTLKEEAPKRDENLQASTTVTTALSPMTSPLEAKEDSQSTEATVNSNPKKILSDKPEGNQEVSNSKTAVIFAIITLAVFALLFTVCYFSTRKPNGCFGYTAAGVSTNTKVTSSDIPLEATH